MPASSKFTLDPRRWYSALFLLPNGEQHSSPVWITAIRAMSKGMGMMELDFWQANYPQGVQDKSYSLRVIRRESGYLLAERKEDQGKNLLLLREVTARWIASEYQEQVLGDVQDWLDRKIRHL